MKSEKIENYLPLIRGVIKRYALDGRYLQEDLEQEGFLGILEAQKRFDSSKGVKFSTYAYFWVKKRVLAYLGKELDQQSESLTEKLLSKVSAPTADCQPDCRADCGEESSLLSHIPEDMPAMEQEVLELFFCEKLELNEIATKLGFSREKVRRLKFKALRRIKAASLF